MNIWESVRLVVIRSSPIVPILLLSACSLMPSSSQEEPSVPQVVVEPVPEPLPEPVVTEQAPEPEPQPVPPAPPPPAAPQNVEPLIAVVISDASPAHKNVSDALLRHLENSNFYDLSDTTLPKPAVFEAINDSAAVAIVAIGMNAAVAANKFSDRPLVIGQVFNREVAEWPIDRTRFVRLLPPIELQIDAWLEIDPDITNVGAIFGPGHDDLVRETSAALRARNIQLRHLVADTDKQTLYHFNRLVRDLDGFILFPDNRILSRGVLSDMMTAANRHGVQMAVYNEPLLQFGAAFLTGK